MIPWLLIVELMGKTGKKLSELIKDRKEKFPSSGEINFKISQPKKVFEKVLKYFDGQLQPINRVPDDLKSIYSTCFEIDTRWLVEAAARRQKWIDQSQSLNLYIPDSDGKKLDSAYKLAWIRGLKTTYYLRSLGATHVEKSTSDNSGSNLNAVKSDEEVKQCLIDDPECEACQ